MVDAVLQAVPKPPERIIQVRPMAKPARMRRRHLGLIMGFLMMVLAPLCAIAWYLGARAEAQYASLTGFTVRQEESGAASSMLGGFAQFAAISSTTGDTDILHEFIQSQELVARIATHFDLVAHYTGPWERDPIFALAPDPSIEDLLDYWQRVVRVSYDQGTGLVELQVLAFDPEMAQRIAQEIVAQSHVLINELNAAARADLMRFAEADLVDASTRLRLAREALTEFRIRTQIVDPDSDIQGRMGVLNNLQQQLAQALIEFDVLAENTNQTDTRVVQANRRIEVIRARIAEERQTFTLQGATFSGQDYPTLMAEYESLTVEREFAERDYGIALAALEMARDNAARETRYLAVYIRPTLAQSAEYPRAGMILGLAFVFLILSWSILTLILYSIRDRR